MAVIDHVTLNCGSDRSFNIEPVAVIDHVTLNCDSVMMDHLTDVVEQQEKQSRCYKVIIKPVAVIDHVTLNLLQ